MSVTRQVYMQFREALFKYTVIRLEVLEENISGPLAEAAYSPRHTNCAGAIKTGLVKEIRVYTYDESIPGFLVNYQSIPGFIKSFGTSERETTYTFIINTNMIISKTRPVVSSTPSTSTDPKVVQQAYYERNPDNGVMLFESYNATGEVEFPVFGSWQRALEAGRGISLPGEKLIGSYTYYHYNGYPAESFTYDIGKVLNGEYRKYYENGQSKIYSIYKDGYLHSDYIEYYETGNIKCRGRLNMGILEGEYAEWDDDGNILFKAYYVDGTLNNSFVLVYPSYV